MNHRENKSFRVTYELWRETQNFDNFSFCEVNFWVNNCTFKKNCLRDYTRNTVTSLSAPSYLLWNTSLRSKNFLKNNYKIPQIFQSLKLIPFHVQKIYCIKEVLKDGIFNYMMKKFSTSKFSQFYRRENYKLEAILPRKKIKIIKQLIESN